MEEEATLATLSPPAACCATRVEDDDDDDDVVIVVGGRRPANNTTARPAPVPTDVSTAPPSSAAPTVDEEEDDEGSLSIAELMQRAGHGAGATLVTSAPTPTPPPSSTVVDGFTITAKYASLPGGFRLPLALFQQLYPYQRHGVAWMWSLHTQCPEPAGALGRTEESSSSAAAPQLPVPSSASASAPKLSGGILADDMGLGKTLQVVSFITGLFYSDAAECVLVVLPVSLIPVWEAEFARFSPKLRVSVLHEVQGVVAREKRIRACAEDGGVVLTTYGMVQSSPNVFGGEGWRAGERHPRAKATKGHPLRGNKKRGAGKGGAGGAGDDEEIDDDGEEEEEQQQEEDEANVVDEAEGEEGASAADGGAARGPGRGRAGKGASAAAPRAPVAVTWDLLVLDEGHKIKNAGTLVAKALRRLPARYRLLLSGTPIQNNMDELWSLLDFTHVGLLLDTRRRFNERIGAAIVAARDRNATAEERLEGVRAMRELLALVGPYLLRREKEKLLAQKAEGDDGDAGAGEASAADASAAGAGGEAADSSIGLPPPPPAAGGLLSLSLAARPATGVASTAMGLMGLKKEVVLWTGLTGAQEAMYRTVCADAYSGVFGDESGGSSSGGLFRAITTLRKIASHPRLIREDERLEIAGGTYKPLRPVLPGGGAPAVPAAGAAVTAVVALDDFEEPLPQPSSRPSASADDWWLPSSLPDTATLVGESDKVRLFAVLLRVLAMEGRKTLVFSQSTRMLDVLQRVTADLYATPAPSGDGGVAGAAEGVEGGAEQPAGDEAQARARGVRVLSSLDEVDGGLPAEPFRVETPSFGVGVGGGDGAASAPSRPGLRSSRVDGSMKADERMSEVRRFNTDPSVAVCFLTTGVGSLGLTLTAATSVIIFDVAWNPAVDAQAVDRAYRVGQTRDVVTYRLIACGTVEEKMYRLQIFKSGIISTVMGASSKESECARGGGGGGCGAPRARVHSPSFPLSHLVLLSLSSPFPLPQTRASPRRAS
jgi:hypothetical protein